MVPDRLAELFGLFAGTMRVASRSFIFDYKSHRSLYFFSKEDSQMKAK